MCLIKCRPLCIFFVFSAHITAALNALKLLNSPLPSNYPLQFLHYLVSIRCYSDYFILYNLPSLLKRGR